VGVHPSDIHDYVAMADAAWHGGVGPWRSASSSDDEDSGGRGLERAGQQRGVRAQDLGLPTIRVRRLPDTGPFGRRRTYEVELTEVGADSPSWTRTTHTPRPLIEPHLGWDEAPTVINAADRAWTGGVGPWATLFPGNTT